MTYDREYLLPPIGAVMFVGCGCAFAATDFYAFGVCAVYWGVLTVHYTDLVSR